MKTISVVNRKGGVGKTTLTSNIGYELARSGYGVILVDMDAQCDLTKLFGVANTSPPSLTILDVLSGRCPIEDACLEVMDSLYLVPGSRDLVHLDPRTDESILRRCLESEALVEMDFVIIDHPPGLNEAALTGFVASDGVLVVSNPEAFSLSNLSDLLQDIEDIKNAFNTGLSVLGIAVNRVDMRRNLTKQILGRLREAYGDHLFETTISNDTSIPNSQNEMKAIRGLPWRSRTVSQFQSLCHEILERMGFKNGDEEAEGEQDGVEGDSSEESGLES